MTKPPRTLILAVAVVGALLATSQQAFASTIIFFVDQREVRASNDSIWRNVTSVFNETITRTPAGQWGYGSASQNTIRTPNFLGGTGSASAAMAEGFILAGAGSSMGVGFEISEPYLADLLVELSVIGTGFASVGLTVTNQNPFFALWSDSINSGSTTVAHQAILQPGRYSFSLGSGVNLFGNVNQPGTTSFSGGLTLTPLNAPDPNPAPVPEPGTMLLMGSGLVLAFKKMRANG